MKRIQVVGVGFLFILLAMFLQGFDSPATGIALVVGMILLFLGGFSWAYKLPWSVALPVGGLLLVTAYSAGMYVPLIIKQKYAGDETPGFLIHLMNFTLGVPGMVLSLAGVARLLRCACHRERKEKK